MKIKTSKASICWNCKNARADRCAWIDKKEQVWERAVEKKCAQDIDVWIVQECKSYKPESAYKKPPKALKKKGTNRLYTLEDDALIISMHKRGVPCKKIASKTGRTQNSIYYRIARLKKMGVKQDDKDSVVTITG